MDKKRLKVGCILTHKVGQFINGLLVGQELSSGGDVDAHVAGVFQGG